MTVNFGGNVYDDAGNAVSGASVKLLETGTTTQEGSTATTDSDGRWDFSEADQDRYDVEITKGSSVRRIKWSDEISLQEIDVRNNTAAGTPAGTFTNLTDNVSNQVAVFSGANATRADGDEIYLSFKLADSAGNLDEFARITAEATDVTNGSEDGQIRFGVSVAGTITDVFTINSTTGGAAEISYEVDSFTIKGGEGEAGVLYLMADQGDDAGDEWKVNVADAGVMTFGNDIASAGTYVTHLTLTPNSTITSSSLTLPGILDVNGSVDWDVSDVQVDSSGDIDLVSSANAAAAIYLHQSTGTSGTIKIHADTGTSVTEGAESINILSDVGGVGIRSTADLAKAINITSDGGTTGAIAIFNDQGTSVTEGAESISLLSDAGGVGIRSTANLANAVNITVDGGTTSSMTLFNDQGTGATEGSASIQLLSDAGGINIKSGLNGANAILLTADAGTSETIVLHADQGSGTGSIQLLSDAGGITLTAGVDIDLAATSDVNLPADVGLTFGDDGEKIEGDGTDLTISGNNINLTATADVVIPADVGITFGSGEKIEGDSTDLTITSGAKINLTATSDVVIPADVGITFGTGEKIEGDNTDLTITSGAKINLTATSDVVIPANVGITFGSGEKIEGDSTDLTITSGAKINLTATSDVVIPANVGITFGSGEKIEGDSTDLTITSGAKINLTATSDVVIPANVGITFGSGEKIEGDDTNITVTSGADINLTATGDVNIPADVGITFGDDAEKIEGDGTDLTVTGNKIKLTPSNAVIQTAGNYFLNDTGSGGTSQGMVINQGANDDFLLEFKSSDVAQNMTGIAEADTYAAFKKRVSTQGGIEILGLSEAERAIWLSGYVDSVNTTKNAGADAPVMIRVAEHDGSNGLQNPSADANLFGVAIWDGSSLGVKFLVDEDGDIYYDGSAAAYDQYDDAAMARAFDLAVSPGEVINNKWDGFVQYNEQTLVETGILGDTIENRGMVNLTQLQRLHNGAISQMREDMMNLVRVLSPEQHAMLSDNTRSRLALGAK